MCYNSIMKIAAVICEYNPFHMGHKYQLDKIKKDLGADYIITLMSGDFVERGEPAVFSKEARAKISLMNGSDLSLLLPLPYATGDADLFSFGAVYILNAINSVDYLVFGAECDDIDLLKEIAVKLKNSATIDSEVLKSGLKEGLTFAKARARLFPEYKDVLDKPNNILAINYLMALNELNSKIEPVIIKRKGSAYNSEILEEKSLPSATAIRSSIKENQDRNNNLTLNKYLPENALSILKSETPVFPDDFTDTLMYALLVNKDILNEFNQVSRELSDKIKNNYHDAVSFTLLAESLKTKEVTRARINRALLHIMLDVKGDNDYFKDLIKNLSYVRVLGFKKASEGLLKVIGDSSKLKLLTKIPAVYDSLNKETKALIDYDVFASTLYDKIAGINTQEFKKQLIIV